MTLPPGPPPQPTISFDDVEHRTASPLPMVIGLVCLLVSTAIAVISLIDARLLATHLWFVLGYVLTPLGVLVCLGWDMSAQRSGMTNPWFDVRRGYTRVLQFVAGLGLLVGGYHIIHLGIWLGQLAVQDGWFG